MTTLAPPAPRVAHRVAIAAALAGALALAALSLLLPSPLAFDPWAWTVWGREVGRLTLDTSSGPSWKPFPVLFTAPFALLGKAAPALWLVVARAGGLLGLAGAVALGTKLAGRWAGVAAAAVTALSPWWFYNTALGNSEGLLAAAVLWAVVAHLAGRRGTAVGLGLAAALMRPEVWPFLVLYGLWLWRARRVDRRVLLGAAALIPLLWFGPDALGAGGALDASKTARGVPSPGSAKLADVPVLALLEDTATLFTVPALIAAVLALAIPDRRVRWLAVGAVAWVAIVAAMTVAGYAGNPRYLVAAAAVGAALAGAGAVRLGERLGVPGALGAVVLVGAVLAVTAGDLRTQGREVESRAAAADAFDDAVAAAGGERALLRCARIRTSPRSRSLVAWELDLPLRDLDAPPVAPAVLIRAKWFYGQGLEPRRPPGYRTLVRQPFWEISAVCGRAPQIDPTARATS
jgi:hypothetical protein